MDVFAANDLCAFTTTAGTPSESTSTGYDSLYTNKSIFLENSAKVRSARFINPDTGASTSLTSGWAHWEGQYSIGTNGGSGGLMHLVNSSGTQVIRLFTTQTGVLRLDYWNGSSFVTGSGTYSSAEGSRLRFDLEFVCGVSGTLNLYVNESFEPVLTVSGMHAAVDDVAFIDFADFNNIVSATHYVSQVLVSEEPTIGAKVGSLIPNANGANTAWTGDYTNVAKTGYSDVSFLESTVAGDKETFGATDRALPVFSYVISGVWVNARGKNGIASPTGVESLVRVAGTDYGAGYNFGSWTDASFGPGVSCFSLNPATAAVWDIADVNAAEVGFESIA